MKDFIPNLSQLLFSIKQGNPVVCRKDTTWTLENKWISLLKNKLNLNTSRLLSIAYTLNTYFDQIECLPVPFSSKNRDKIAELYADLLQVTQQLLADLKGVTSPDSLHLILQLKRKYMALLYRLEGVNDGLDKSAIQTALLPSLKKMAADWKSGQSNLVNKNVSQADISVLKETSRYPLFAEGLLVDSELQKKYFEWALRDRNPIAPFIEFPVLQQKLVDCALNGRISRFGGDALKIEKISVDGKNYQKILTLPFEKKPLSLLDEKLEITFRGNYRLTLAEVFKVFKDKLYRVGNLEFMADGIINWNVHHLGWWDADKQAYQKIDLEQSAWWTQLPLLETITKSEARARYHLPADGIQWIVGAKATRGTPTLDYDQTHAFMELAIPLPDRNSYTVYNFGKFAYQFPSSFFNSLTTFCLNMHATIAYPDENIFYTHRQTGCYPILINELQGIRLMQLIKEDILKARGMNLVFQIESENCAKWLYEKLTVILGHQIPDFFRMSLMKTEPVGFVGACFAFMRKLGLSEKTQFRLLTLVHIPFGSGQGTPIIENGQPVLKTLDTHEFWETSIVYLPALLVEKIYAGQLVLDDSLCLISRNTEFRPYKAEKEFSFPAWVLNKIGIKRPQLNENKFNPPPAIPIPLGNAA